MEAIGTLLTIIGTLAFWVSFVSLFRPLKRIGLPTRKRSSLALLLSFAVITTGAALAPDKPDQASTQAIDQAEPVPTAQPEAPADPPPQTEAPVEPSSPQVEASVEPSEEPVAPPEQAHDVGLSKGYMSIRVLDEDMIDELRFGVLAAGKDPGSIYPA